MVNNWQGRNYATKADFESVTIRTFDFKKILNNDSQDPDQHFYLKMNLSFFELEVTGNSKHPEI